jgi:hypothetical protein
MRRPPLILAPPAAVMMAALVDAHHARDAGMLHRCCFGRLENS